MMKLKLYPNELIPVKVAFTHKKVEQDNPLHFLRIYLRFGYALCFIPFKVVYAKKTGVYWIKSTEFRKMACGIVHGLSAIRFLLALRDELYCHALSSDEQNPVLYFEIGRSIMTTVYMFAFKWTFWMNQCLFCSIINDLERLKYLNLVRRSRFCLRIKVCSTALCFLYSVTPIISVLVGSGAIHIVKWSPTNLMEGYAGTARHTFFLQSNKNPFPIDQFGIGTYILVGIYGLMNFYYFLGGHFFDLSVLMGALTLRHLAESFSMSVGLIRDSMDSIKVYEEYETLKSFSRKINRALGCVTFCFVIEAFPYYATHLDDILTLDDGYAKFRYIFYILNFFFILVTASDIASQVDSYGTWIAEGNNSMKLSCQKLIVLIHELSSKPVGLQVGGIVTITYGFVGTMVSIVITYAVIILQFNYSTTNNNTRLFERRAAVCW